MKTNRDIEERIENYRKNLSAIDLQRMKDTEIIMRVKIAELEWCKK